ncbi:unnamed protein product [Rotaria sp. Silwood2]|nr:unnamed protein product [Rotaria sp. Silwood2]CAF2612172.1 unnamed protein product [Rotaria sp. Silwood2]CAF2873427.1 unnamed protein product [Rotaria sp. Silwood2]CAF3025453.1 unnamed protein product [Rotaria sp. Silwood2]CAF4322583.1 unnamed protein product [Rotaria sp. Silwood2]
MVDKITIPTAHASILWLIGEYSDPISKLAPDDLRKMTKIFPKIIVKYQLLNLAAKLYLMNPKQIQSLVFYVLSLAKYDTNYDTRDKARLLRTLLFQSEKCPSLSRNAKKILLAPKPATILESILRGHEQYTIGTLSYVVGQKAAGYQDLPDFPLEPSDRTVRNVEIIRPPTSLHEQLRKFCTNAGIEAGGKKTNRTDEEEESEESSDKEEKEPASKQVSTVVESFLGATSTSTLTLQQTNKINILDDLNSLQSSAVNYYQQYDRLNRIKGQGLQIQYRFPRTPFGATIISSIYIDFNDKTQPALFDISFDGKQLSILCHVGELIEQEFNQNLARLRGINEIIDSVKLSEIPKQKKQIKFYNNLN